MLTLRILALATLAIPAMVLAQDGWVAHERAGPNAGPTALVVAVDPGRGAAAEVALRQIGRQVPARGRLVTARSSRFGEGGAVRCAPTLEQLVAAVEPDAVIVLREDRAPQRELPICEGTTVAAVDVDADAIRRLKAWLDRVARDTAGGAWTVRDTRRPAWSGAAPLWVITTTHENERKAQRLSLRARQHRAAVHHLLAGLGMVAEGDRRARILPSEPGGPIRVGVYDGPGAISSSGHGPPWIVATLGREPGFVVEPIGPADIAAGALADCDVVLFGGGGARGQGEGLGASGRELVRSAVATGVGYVGICAGAFLACTDSDHDLGLIDVTAEAARGSLVVDAVFDGSLGLDGVFEVRYSNGPRLRLGATEGMSRPRVWARFGERGMDGARAALIGSPAIVAATFGAGRAVAFSPHCERAPGPRRAFVAALRWAARREAR